MVNRTLIFVVNALLTTLAKREYRPFRRIDPGKSTA
jgi:hypothetical protein